jgi:hypothetical protein
MSHDGRQMNLQGPLRSPPRELRCVLFLAEEEDDATGHGAGDGAVGPFDDAPAGGGAGESKGLGRPIKLLPNCL